MPFTQFLTRHSLPLFAVTCATLACALVLRFPVLAQLSSIATLQRRATRYETLLSTRTDKENLTSVIRRKQRQLDEKYARLTAGLHDPGDLSGLLQIIFDRARRAGVRIDKTQPQNPIPVETHIHYPIVLQVQAHYHSLGTFISSLEKLPHLLHVTRIALKAEKNGRITAQMRVICMLNASS